MRITTKGGRHAPILTFPFFSFRPLVISFFILLLPSLDIVKNIEEGMKRSSRQALFRLPPDGRMR